MGGGRADGRTGGRGLRVDERTGGRAGGRTDEQTGAGTLGGRVDEGGQWADEGGHAGQTSGRRRQWADRRTGGRRISEGKTPNLTCHLTWPWEIQCGRPRVTVKLPDLPPSR